MTVAGAQRVSLLEVVKGLNPSRTEAQPRSSGIEFESAWALVLVKFIDVFESNAPEQSFTRQVELKPAGLASAFTTVVDFDDNWRLDVWAEDIHFAQTAIVLQSMVYRVAASFRPMPS